ncbi:MAG: nickel pincer cofactor biosynthesis protein LarC [Bacteroidales bacterium]
MKKILYYDCFAGISGDMHLAAMIDLGVPVEYIQQQLQKLALTEYRLEVKKIVTHGISSTRVSVHLTESKSQTVQVDQLPSTVRKHGHKHDPQPLHRSFADIRKVIEESGLSIRAKSLSIKIFERLAQAEGKVHNLPAEQVHFHEVGAVDSIVDIVGAAICIDYLSPDRIVSSPVELGSGMVQCAHGVYPVPAPATAELMQNIPVTLGKIPFEATTPTGAAILSAVVDDFQNVKSFVPVKIGYGAGSKDSDIPNVLRIFMGQYQEESPAFEFEQVLLVECNIDDMNPELYEHVVARLFEVGAQDVYLTPVLMKKMRPAQKISVLCNKDIFEDVKRILLNETTTLGVRALGVDKWMLNREILTLETSLGKVRVKKSFGPNVVKFKAEYDDCMEIAKKMNRPLPEVMRIIQQEIAEKMLEGK